MDLGSRVRPQTNRRKRDLSVVPNSSITSQNHCTNGAVESIPENKIIFFESNEVYRG
jgi:hypothetical protein